MPLLVFVCSGQVKLAQPHMVNDGLLTLDCRLMHVEHQLMWMPLQAPNPTEDDLLPTTNLSWDNHRQMPLITLARYPANVSPNVVVGPFQRLCQCALLFTRALVWEFKSYELSNPTRMESFNDLDVATRALIEAMLRQQSTNWGEYFECFSTCTWYVHLNPHPELVRVQADIQHAQSAINTVSPLSQCRRVGRHAARDVQYRGSEGQGGHAVHSSHHHRYCDRSEQPFSQQPRPSGPMLPCHALLGVPLPSRAEYFRPRRDRRRRKIPPDIQLFAFLCKALGRRGLVISSFLSRVPDTNQLTTQANLSRESKRYLRRWMEEQPQSPTFQYRTYHFIFLGSSFREVLTP